MDEPDMVGRRKKRLKTLHKRHGQKVLEDHADYERQLQDARGFRLEAPGRPEQDMNHARAASLTARLGSEDIELPNKAELLYCAGASAPLDERPNL